MKVAQFHYVEPQGWDQELKLDDSSLVFVFGGRKVLEDTNVLEEIKSACPHDHIVGCSTSGEIIDVEVHDDTVVVSALSFDKVSIESSIVNLEHCSSSGEAGVQAAKAVSHEDLKHVVVFCDGLNLNGSEFVQEVAEHLPENVTVTGGLAGDGANFESTCVVGKGEARSKSIVVIGFYGDSFRVSYASLGGWDPFGPERLVTKSEGNVLYGLNGEPALELYRKYLGDHASELPASGLLFPLSIRVDGQEERIVRTILGITEEHGSITFAGDVPEGSYAQLMRANFDRLIDGASGAANEAVKALESLGCQFALLISCVGRKMVLNQRIEEEVEGVRDVLGANTKLAGFYSYGEISPFTPHARCELHNQTMTITAFAED